MKLTFFHPFRIVSIITVILSNLTKYFSNTFELEAILNNMGKRHMSEMIENEVILKSVDDYYISNHSLESVSKKPIKINQEKKNN